MTNRRNRLSKIDDRLSTAVKERKQSDEKNIANLLFSARHHATAVAALVLAGQPKIDEPLINAWNRALKHYEVESKPWGGLKAQVRAVEQLRPKVMEGKESTARYSEIFAAAPIWLLQFTGLAMDARLLKFSLPDTISSRLNWGDQGYEEAIRWPELPSGTMTAGEPIPTTDARQIWLVMFCMLTAGDPVQAVNDRFSAESEKLPSCGDSLLDEMAWATLLVLDERPEDDWSAYEKRRVRKLCDRVSQLQKQPRKGQR
jgi:hypothetical protein